MTQPRKDSVVIVEQMGAHIANTIVGTNGVYYDVCETINGEEVTVWTKTVLFLRDKSHRCGGYAFQSAAREQESILNRLNQESN